MSLTTETLRHGVLINFLSVSPDTARRGQDRCVTLLSPLGDSGSYSSLE